MNDRDLTIAICQLLGELPGWSWSTTGTYPADRVGVFYGPIPDAPDRAVGVRVYGGTDDPEVYSPTRSVQLLFRGARNRPDGADELADEAFTPLQRRVRSGGINFAYRISFGPLGADGNGRQERADNYQIVIENTEVTR